jgi:hypothetical protein
MFAELSAILFRHDLVGINFESNTDEYDPEAGTILPRLRPGMTTEEVAGIVREEFIQWFGTEAPRTAERYLPVAGEIRAAYERWLGTG